MSRVVFGLDVGTDSIKVSCARRSLTGIRVARVFHEVLPLGESAEVREEAAVRALQGFFATAGSHPVWSALPVSAAYLRALDLPVSKAGKIREVIPFAMEPHLPIAMEDIVVDFLLRKAESQGGAAVLAAGVPGAEIGKYLDLLSRGGVDPVRLGLDLPAAAYPLTDKRRREGGPLRLLIDFGAGKTSFAVIQGGRITSLRSLPVGGLHLTRAIAQEKNLFLPEAEEFKKNSLPQDFRQWPEAVTAHFEYLRRELEKTLRVSGQGSNSEVRPPVEIVLCGGAARTGGLREYLSAHLACPVLSWRLEGQAADGDSAEDESLFAVSSGLALMGIASERRGLDFRRGEFAPPEPRTREKAHLAATTSGLVLLLALIGGTLWWRTALERRRLDDLRGRVEATYRRTFPGTKRVVDAVAQMRQSVQQDEDKLKGVPAFGPAAPGALSLLRELSERIPSRVQWTVNELSLSPGEVSLRGQTDSFENVEEIRRALESSPLFSGVRVSNVQGGGGKKTVEAAFLLPLKKDGGGGFEDGKGVHVVTR